MALNFASVTDVVNHGSGSSVDDLSAFSVVAWVRRTADQGNGAVWQKGWTPASAGTLFMVERDGVGPFTEGHLRLIRGGTSLADCMSQAGRVPLNTWTCIAVAASAFATANGVDLFYGNLSTPVVEEATYFTETDGSGSYGSDSGANGTVGGDGSSFYFDGDIALVRVFNRKLTLAEVQREQYSRFAVTTGCVVDCEFHGTGTQMDLSGNGNNGTVTGATAVDHPPFSKGRIVKAIRSGASRMLALYHYRRRR